MSLYLIFINTYNADVAKDFIFHTLWSIYIIYSNLIFLLISSKWFWYSKVLETEQNQPYHSWFIEYITRAQKPAASSGFVAFEPIVELQKVPIVTPRNLKQLRVFSWLVYRTASYLNLSEGWKKHPYWKLIRPQKVLKLIIASFQRWWKIYLIICRVTQNVISDGWGTDRRSE